MLCADSYQSSPTGSSMEKELLRNLKLNAVHNPAILHSFVTELSFWDVEGRSRHGSRSNSGLGSRGSSSSSRSRKSKIPSMQEATRSYEKEEREIAAAMKRKSNAVWKSAVDPATGKIYYYDAVSRKTQWHKPSEMKAAERKMKMERKKRDRIFFDEMEKNIMNSLALGDIIPGVKEVPKAGSPKEPLPKTRVRTISGMDDVLLAELRDDYNVQDRVKPHERRILDKPSLGNRQSSASNRRNHASHVAGRPPLPSSRSGRITINNDDEDDLLLSPDMEDKTKQKQAPSPRNAGGELTGVKFLNAPIHNEKHWRYLGNDMLGVEKISSPPGHARRNTGGTIYLQHTMINPDIQATIKCVCGVYRAHIVQATKDSKSKQQRINSVSHEYDAFCDLNVSNRDSIPPLAEVVEFYDAFYRRSQMEHDTIITSIIYVERVIKSTNAALTPNTENWRSLLFACMVLASKVWDDLSMWNIDFSNVSAHTAGLFSFTLRRINQLELELLKCLKFDVRVPAGEYAKYYFLIRTMLLRSGLVKEDEKPLQKRDAFKQLEKMKNAYLKQSPPQRVTRDRRSKSMDDSISTVLANKNPLGPGPVLKDSVCLEQLVG